TWTRAQVEQMIINQEIAGGDATIVGFVDGTNTFTAGASDETFEGRGGTNTYVYSSAGGNDVVDDGGSHSVLVFSDIAAAGVTLGRNGAGNDLTLTIDATGKTVTVRNQFNYLGVGTLQTVTFADGTVWAAAQIRQMLLDQESAAAGGAVYGYANSNDTLIAGPGDKYLNGDGGADTYKYSSAGGNDIVDDGGNQSSLVFTDIDAGAVSLSRAGASLDLVITDTTTAKTVTVKGQFSGIGDGTLQAITFADGTVWSPAQVKQMLLYQESAQTGGSLYGYANSNDTLVAGLGDKYLNGEGGADTYVYASADGNDIIDDGGNQSKLVLTDINSTDVSLATSSQNANDLIITNNVTGKTVLVLGQFSNIAAGTLQSFAFADGVTWTAAEVAVLANADTVYAGTGDKTLSGRNRPLDYVYSTAGGNDVIDDGGNQSKLTFLDIASSGVSLSRSGRSRDLTMTILATGKTLTIAGQFSGIGAGTLQSITFADGVAWTPGQVKQMLLDQESAQTGGSVYGYANTADTLVAGLGDKYLNALGDVGGIGTYVYSAAGGNDTIDDGGNQSSLVFSDINATDVNLSRNGASRDLVITDDVTGKTVTVLGQFSGIAAGTLQSFTFADGAMWTAAQVKQMLLNQESAQNGGSIFGYANTTDTLVAGLGDKYLNALGDVGGVGTYVYSSAGGNDTIDDGGNQSKLVFTDIDPAGVALAWPTGTNDLVITVLATGKTVTVHNQFSGIAAGTLQSFTFADATVWTAAQVQAMLAPSTASYAFDKGEGHLTIHPGMATTITLGADIAASDVALQADSAGDFTIRLRDTGETLTVDADLSGQYWGIASVIGTLVYGDGTSIALNRGWSTPFTFNWLGESGNMTLNGAGFGNNVFELGPNDVANSVFGWGNTFDFATGDGPVTINPTSGGNTVNTIQMAAGITASDVIFQADAAGDLFIKLLSTGDTIKVTNDLSGQYWGIASQVGTLAFADGTSISLNRPWSTPFTLDWLGQSGNMTLTGAGFGNNTYELGPNDVVTGAYGWGNTYDFAKGDGPVTINPASGQNVTNVIQMAAGISASDVVLESDASQDLIVRLRDTGDVITATNDLSVQNWGIASQVTAIDFADGTSISLERGWSNDFTWTWLGGGGNATLNGAILGNNVYELGPNDVATGATGWGNTYEYAEGDGSVTINPGTGANVTNAVQLGTGISSGLLWFAQQGNDLQVDEIGTSDQLTIKSWNAGGNGQTLSFGTADGAKLDNSLAQLISAMATYSSSNPGFNPATATQMPNDPTLQSAIASSWHH
ncbi:MAG TPA: calcium-binding protein, partial [Xanthobacteraceae bacterium]|nr:calcium-binding protein [Xanthobacteraceae bacterium]